MSTLEVMSNVKSTTKLINTPNNYLQICRTLILFYTFIGVSYLLFVKSNPKCACRLSSTKTLSTENTLFAAKNSIVDSPITAMPIMPPDKPRRNLLQTPTASPIRPIDASIKRNYDLIAKNSIADSLITPTSITTMPISPPDIPRRNLLQTPTAAPIRPIAASIKRNHDLILNMYDMFPNGIVIIWYGLISNIPPGFALCDGSNGTPDLRDKFVIGGGNLYNLNDNGGSTTTTITSTNQLP
eukprot:160111_1